MKKISILFSFVCVCYLLLGVGCKPKVKPVNTNAVRFDSIQVDETYHLHNDTTKPCCNIQISFVYPDSSGAQELKELQNLFIEKMLGDSFKDLSPEQAIKEYTKQYIEGFKQFENSVIDTTYADEENKYVDETGYSYYTKLKNTILYNQNGFVSFTVESLVYEGGAHSSKSIYGYVVNPATGELLQEDQFAGKNYQFNISYILANKIAESNGVDNVKELENLGYNSLCDITPNQNFTLDNKGITYYFNENEIAGTMVGIIPVFIPYNELQVYVAKDSPIARLINQ
jgi:hypothetical protein